MLTRSTKEAPCARRFAAAHCRASLGMAPRARGNLAGGANTDDSGIDPESGNLRGALQSSARRSGMPTRAGRPCGAAR